MIIGAYSAHSVLGVAALSGAILAAAYMLSYTRKAFFGPIIHDDVRLATDLQPREMALLLLPALLALLFGLFPNYILDINQIAAEAWLSRIGFQSP
jgi:NADH-quinone oxidoreductase subunit M